MPQFLRQKFPECHSISRTIPLSFCLFLSTARSHLWQKIWEPSSVCCDILGTVKWQISCCCGISHLAHPACAVYMQSEGGGLQKGEGKWLTKKWEWPVSRRNIPSQNLYRDEKTISNLGEDYLVTSSLMSYWQCKYTDYCETDKTNRPFFYAICDFFCSDSILCFV